MDTQIFFRAFKIGRSATRSLAVPAESCSVAARGSISLLAIAACAAAAFAAPAWSAQSQEAVVGGQDANAVSDADSAAQASWRKVMGQVPTRTEGCFHASYPNVLWEKVECNTVQTLVHPVRVSSPAGAGQTTGNGHDWVAGATGLISAALGQFATNNVKTEKGVGVASFGGGGILGKNEYSLQINTNANETTSVCAGHSGCVVWQQYVYATDYNVKGKAAVFIQYWLINWGGSACPKGWLKSGEACFKNSSSVAAPNVPITSLAKMALEGTANPGGNDSAILGYGANTYSITAKDSVLQVGAVWREVEFNVVGNAGGSRATFNKGAQVVVGIQLADGSTAAPNCILNAGTTGETNNLNLGACERFSGTPGIQFIETH
jgi:hypothetical protein